MTRGKIILGTKTQCEMDELLWSIVWQLFLPCAAQNATTYLQQNGTFFSSYKNGSTKKICGVAHLLVQSYVLEMTAFHHYENEFDFLGGVLFDWFDSSGGSGSHSKRQMSHD